MSRGSTTVTHWGAYEARVRGGRLQQLVPISGDSDPSPIGDSMPGALHGSCRILRPAVRRSFLEGGAGSRNERRGAEPFIEIGWDAALDLVAGELTRVRRDRGNRAIFGGSYGWASAGRFHHSVGHLHRLLNLAGGYVSSVNSYSTAAAEVIVPRVLGNFYSMLMDATSWQSIAAHTRLFVAFGGVPLKNAQVNAGGVSDHRVRHWMEQCAQRGVRVVNVSPIRTDVAESAGVRWIAPRPNTDVALMLGIAHTIIAAGRHDAAFLERYCVGFDRLRRYIEGVDDGCPKSAEWAASITGVGAEAIRDLAFEMLAAPTFISLSWSLQRADHGEQPYWMGIALAALLGGIGKPGEGVGFGYGAVASIGATGPAFRGPTFPQGTNPVREFIPVARIADMLLSPGEAFDYDGRRLAYPDIELVYWAGGNPFHHHQDINRLLEAWRRPRTIVVHEQYWNASARHADIVLPANTSLERNDLATATRDSAILAMRKAVEPIGESRSDYDICRGVAARMGLEPAFSLGRDEFAWLRVLYEECRAGCAAQDMEIPGFDEFWERGRVDLPGADPQRVLLSAFREAPDAHPLATPSGRIELHSETIAAFGYDDCPGHPVWLDPYEWLGSPRAARFPLHLISNQPVGRLHSQYDHGSNSVSRKVAGREPLLIHPDDAASRSIRAGDVVRVFNDRGACLAGAVLTEDVRAGVVQLATGAWYSPAEPGVIGSLDTHGNPNVLTRDKGTSKLAQGPSAHSTLVQVEACACLAPRVAAFDPPRFAGDVGCPDG